jgi:hypothetical protein
MTTTINATPTNGLVATGDGSGVLKVQSNGVTTNALAWVNYNGATAVRTIRSSYNVSSVTYNSAGDYTVNFTTAMADANYIILGSGGGTSTNLFCVTPCDVTTARTASACRVNNSYANSIGTNDTTVLNVAIFGN